MFGNSNSNDHGSEIDTSLIVQKPFLKSSFNEAIIEEDIDLKNQFRIKNLPNCISIREATSKIFVDDKFNDPIIKNYCSCWF